MRSNRLGDDSCNYTRCECWVLTLGLENFRVIRRFCRCRNNSVDLAESQWSCVSSTVDVMRFLSVFGGTPLLCAAVAPLDNLLALASFHNAPLQAPSFNAFNLVHHQDLNSLAGVVVPQRPEWWICQYLPVDEPKEIPFRP